MTPDYDSVSPNYYNFPAAEWFKASAKTAKRREMRKRDG
jgi:hypothetical protein